MLKEHDRIVLTGDLPGEGLQAGDAGTIVHVHRGAAAFEVEFFALDGSTITVSTVPTSLVRAVTGRDVTHARVSAKPA